MNLRHLPNLITILRILLVFPLLYFLLIEQFTPAFYLFVIAAASDGLDGILARKFGWMSRFGAFLDPLADKLLMMTSFSALAWLGLIPLWLFFIVIMRDVIIMSGVSGVFFIVGNVDFEPSMISKINTALQLLLVTLILFDVSVMPLPEQALTIVIFMVVATTVLSVCGYIYEGLKQVIVRNKNES